MLIIRAEYNRQINEIFGYNPLMYYWGCKYCELVQNLKHYPPERIHQR